MCETSVIKLTKENMQEVFGEKNWNKGKKEEFRQRDTFDVKKKKSVTAAA